MYGLINARAGELAAEMTQRRRDFHKYAESGWLEMRTASLIAAELKALGYDVFVGREVCDADARMGLPPADALEAHYAFAKANGADADFIDAVKDGFTGVIGILHAGEGPTLAMRFDIDALGVVECGAADHRPSAEGFASIERGVMHACGHDGHASIGLGVAKLLTELRDSLSGTVKLIFQPAEEGVRGAASIVAKGWLDDADYVLASHITNNAYCPNADIALPDPSRARGLSTTKLNAVIRGRSSHAGAAPQLGNNAMLAAAAAITNLHAIPRFGSVATQLNVGTLTAGSGRNVVCELAKMELEVRGATNEANEYMETYARRIIDAAAKMHGCTAEISVAGRASAFTSSEALTARVGRVCEEHLGMRLCAVQHGGGGSEDFSYMAERVMSRGGESVYFSILTNCAAPNHNDRFDFDEGVLVKGVRAFVGAAYDILKK